MDIVSIRRQGRQKFYKANAEHPLFPDLKRIIYKTSALGDKLREALGGLKGVDAAFIYGSVANGSERGTSDVDLMILGAPDPEGLTHALQDVEKELGREVSPTIMSTGEWHDRLASLDAFVTQLVDAEKIFLKGDERSLRTA
jgi:predicted nucleotidyltransferase